jgi:small subunit ribosomal protein S5
MVHVQLKGRTVPHSVVGKCGASKVVLVPASEGTGVIAGKKLRPLLELAGIHDVLTKAYGSTSPKNLLKAGMDALKQLRTAEAIKALRGVELS